MSKYCPTIDATDPDWFKKAEQCLADGSGVAVDFSSVREKGEKLQKYLDKTAHIA